MLLSLLHLRNSHFKQVSSLLSLFSTSLKHHYSTSLLQEPPPPPLPSSTLKTNNTHINLSSIDFSGIAKSVISRCSLDWDKKTEPFSNPSLKDLILRLSNFSPKIARRFIRVSALKPEDVLEILLGFDCDHIKSGNEATKIESLWGIFKWASEQSGDFKHLQQSCKVMASMLVRVGMYRDAEFLLSTVESGGILLQCDEIFSNLIAGYLGEADLERSISLYNQMRGLGLVPSLACYRGLISHLVQVSETHLAFRVCVDMVDMGMRLSITDRSVYENVICLLCRDGKIQEARNLVKKVVNLGMQPSNIVLNAIAGGYCEKKDYDDVLSFFAEINCAPDVVIGNMIIHSLCRDFDVERAIYFMEELENLGYCPDEITFAILIGWSCREGKLKNAFIFLSEISSRSLKPHIYSYNALMSGVFLDGMWKHGQEILDEMNDIGIEPDMSTFRVLLAGYCKARQFDEVKMTVQKMVDRNLIQFFSQQDPLTKAFTFLGLDSSDVKIRRDNDVGFSKTEFFDNLGNGLYLETDVDEYEKTMAGVLVDSMIPDYNSLVLKFCGDKNFKTPLVMFDEMMRWGQDLSLSAFSLLVKGLCQSGCNIKVMTSLLEKMPKLTKQLDQDTVNLLVQAHCKNGSTQKARRIFDGALQRRLQIDNDTYTSLITSLCKKGDLRYLHKCWELAREDKWLPDFKESKVLLGFLCQRKMFKSALDLLETIVAAYPHLVMDTFHFWLEKLCDMGFTGSAHLLVEELIKRGFVLDCLAYSHLIRGFCKEKRLSEAFMICDIMLAKNLAPDFDVSVLLIPHLCRAGNYDKAISLKEISVREQPPLSLSVHCALMSSFCKMGMVEGAANLLQEMLLRGLIPDIEVYNILVQGFCLAKNYLKIGELLGIMIRKNISISISSYRKLVFLMCIDGRVTLAFSLKELMLKESNPSHLVVYNILIFYLFLSRRSAHVDTLLDELQARELQPDAATYNFLVYGFSRCEGASRSLKYLTAMMSKELRPSNRCVREVISCLCQEGDLSNTLKLSREMESRGWVHGSSIQSNIVELLLTHGELQEAVEFLDHMEEKCLISNNINYDKIINQLCSYEKKDKAIDLLDIMLKKGKIPSSTSYDYIIQGLCKSHKTDEALDLHTEMMYRNLKPNIQTWNVLVNSLCEGGRTAEAERLITSMAQIGETPSREMYQSVSNRYRFDNNVSKALEILQEMQRNGYGPDFETHWSLIRNLSISGDKENIKNGPSFLSRLLSNSGFSRP
ncbi:hypothetical protein LguiB_008955 [Lonicera macranthoides]